MNNYIAQAKALLSAIGVHQLSDGEWAFTDVDIANQAHIHHSQLPVALAAYAAVNVAFAAGRFPGWALVDLVDKVPCMDSVEHTALAMVCRASPPAFPSAIERGNIFGRALWGIVETYSLQGCFEYLERPLGIHGKHYMLRPLGFNCAGGNGAVSESSKAMRKSYCAMSSVQQIMVLTIVQLYYPGKDNRYLFGRCPTKISAAEAMDILRKDGWALSVWALLVTHYAGW